MKGQLRIALFCSQDVEKSLLILVLAVLMVLTFAFNVMAGIQNFTLVIRPELKFMNSTYPRPG